MSTYDTKFYKIFKSDSQYHFISSVDFSAFMNSFVIGLSTGELVFAPPHSIQQIDLRNSLFKAQPFRKRTLTNTELTTTKKYKLSHNPILFLKASNNNLSFYMEGDIYLLVGATPENFAEKLKEASVTKVGKFHKETKLIEKAESILVFDSLYSKVFYFDLKVGEVNRYEYFLSDCVPRDYVLLNGSALVLFESSSAEKERKYFLVFNLTESKTVFEFFVEKITIFYPQLFVTESMEILVSFNDQKRLLYTCVFRDKLSLGIEDFCLWGRVSKDPVLSCIFNSKLNSFYFLLGSRKIKQFSLETKKFSVIVKRLPGAFRYFPSLAFLKFVNNHLLYATDGELWEALAMIRGFDKICKGSILVTKGKKEEKDVGN